MAAVVLLLSAFPARATHEMSKNPRLAAQRLLMVPLTGRRLRAIATTALFHTLFNDFASEGDGTTYVQTGDIPAMWLRDSAAQTIPYIRFQPFFPALRQRFAGVLERDARNILIDPYANAFTARYGVWERKWEIDSLASVIGLAYRYWRSTADRTTFTTALHAAMRAVVSTYECERHHQRCSNYPSGGRSKTSYNYAGETGLIWSAFRPSDDPVVYRFNIPQEMSAVVALKQLAVLARDGYNDANLAAAALGTAYGVESGIERYGHYYDFSSGWTYVYETDGEGHALRMDDANIPDLLSIPFIGYRDSRDPGYLNTRRFILSSENPYYYKGKYANGLGSPHTPAGWIWPLGIITRALTATSAVETSASITMLAETDSADFLIHESFDPNAYWHYTRTEFGWANALYAELIFRTIAGFGPQELSQEKPLTLFQPVWATPTLAPPIVQLENQGRLVQTLGDLLHMLQ
ncbi:MAG: glycoside hydrolase family 125 protein [Vulcanimicrobiaceae bacterium]